MQQSRCASEEVLSSHVWSVRCARNCANNCANNCQQLHVRGEGGEIRGLCDQVPCIVARGQNVWPKAVQRCGLLLGRERSSPVVLPATAAAAAAVRRLPCEPLLVVFGFIRLRQVERRRKRQRLHQIVQAVGHQRLLRSRCQLHLLLQLRESVLLQTMPGGHHRAPQCVPAPPMLPRRGRVGGPRGRGRPPVHRPWGTAVRGPHGAPVRVHKWLGARGLVQRRQDERRRHRAVVCCVAPNGWLQRCRTAPATERQELLVEYWGAAYLAFCAISILARLDLRVSDYKSAPVCICAVAHWREIKEREKETAQDTHTHTHTHTHT